MTCREVRDVADSFLCDELLTETNHEILRHLDTCAACRAEIDARRRLRVSLRAAFERAPDLQPDAGFADRLRRHVRTAAMDTSRAPATARRWFALAAGIALAAGLAAAVFLLQTLAPADALARDAIGDHRNCALKFRLVRMPVPLADAAEQFDRAYRLLLDAPPNDVRAPGGPVRVIERHSCVYGERRFGHVILEYRGKVVSLLMTANESPAVDRSDAYPHLTGRSRNGLSVVSVDAARHAILLVSDLESADLADLAKRISLPLAQQLDARLAPAAPETLLASVCPRAR